MAPELEPEPEPETLDVGVLEAFSQQYRAHASDSSGGRVDVGRVEALLRQGGRECGLGAIQAALKTVFPNGHGGSVSAHEFRRLVSALRGEGPRDGGRRSSLANTGKGSRITRIAGATDSSQHSVDSEEIEQYVLHINHMLSASESLRALHIPAPDRLFEACQDGVVLAALINDSVPDTIDERVVNRGARLNLFQRTENNNLVINSAKAIGCSVVNIGPLDLIEGRQHLVLGLIWQVIKVGLLSFVSLHYHPELYRLLGPGEALAQLLKLPADALLLRWFNFHLKEAGWHRQVANLGPDISDSENYIVLLSQLCPRECSRAGLREPDPRKRAEAVLQAAARIGCHKYVTARAICEGNPRLNLAFVANFFNHHPGLAPLSEEMVREVAKIDESLFASQGDREARAFALWMNSLGVEPFVHSLADDLRDGRVLLQVFDRIRPGSVAWRRVNRVGSPPSRFKCLENTNLVVATGCQWGFSLVGIQGADLTDGRTTLTLALVWQLMRAHVVETLKGLGRGGQEVTDHDIIGWANGKASGDVRIQSFRDEKLGDSRFLLSVMNGMQADVVDTGLLSGDRTSNARYAINVARKMGAAIFCLPEDIVEVRPKMILTLLGTLMALDQPGRA